MEKLIDTYKRIGWILLAISTLVLTLSHKTIVPWLTEREHELLADVVTSTTIYGAIYIGGLALFEKRGWILRYPALNFRGTWFFVVVTTSGNNTNSIYSRGKADIRQTALSIQISGGSNKTPDWAADHITFNDRAQGVIRYSSVSTGNSPSSKKSLVGYARFYIRSLPGDHGTFEDSLPAARGPVARVRAWYHGRIRFNENRALVFECDEWSIHDQKHGTCTAYYTKKRMSDDEILELHADFGADCVPPPGGVDSDSE